MRKPLNRIDIAVIMIAAILLVSYLIRAIILSDISHQGIRAVPITDIVPWFIYILPGYFIVTGIFDYMNKK